MEGGFKSQSVGECNGGCFFELDKLQHISVEREVVGKADSVLRRVEGTRSCGICSMRIGL